MVVEFASKGTYRSPKYVGPEVSALVDSKTGVQSSAPDGDVMVSRTRISAVIVNFNGIGTVLETIRSLLSMRGVDCEVIVLDDGSTDGSPDAIRREFPQVRVEQESRNTRQVNRLRSAGLALAHTRHVLLTDNDVMFDADCARRLLAVMDAEPTVAVCLPRLMCLGDPARVYHAGGLTHYVGATIAAHRGSVDYVSDGTPVPAVGGGIALLDMRKVERVGTFDEDYELAWGDDGELHQRLLLAGCKCLLVPDAIGYHEPKTFGRGRHYRARGQVRNRWRFIGTHYGARTLALIAPALAAYEVMQAGFYLLRRVPHLYVLGTLDSLRDVPAIIRRRRTIQALRAVSDKDILFAGPIYIRSDHNARGAAALVRAAMRAISWLFGAYWSLIQPFLAGRGGAARRTGAPAKRVLR